MSEKNENENTCDNCGSKIAEGKGHFTKTYLDEDLYLCENCWHTYFECNKCHKEISMDDSEFRTFPMGEVFCPICWKKYDLAKVFAT
jgi:ribosomal protein L24E